jgi:aromatic ring-opening dioxygenase catalytic subunit (LigB family)
MLTARAWLVPNLPTLVLDEHRRHRTPMLEALGREAMRLAEDKPDVIAALSARWVSPGPFQVDVGRRHRTLTDYPGLGVELRYDCTGYPALARALVDAGAKQGVRVGPAQRGVDSGVTVPLHFLIPRRTVPVIPLSIAARPAAECRAWGAIVRRVLEARPEKVALVVGGMLSHDAHAWSFQRDVPEARAFDEHALKALAAGKWDQVTPGDSKVVERAHPEADLRHLDFLRGFLGSDVQAQVLCYESGPGVGGALAAFETAAVPARPATSP